MTEFLLAYGRLIALVAAAWVFYDARRRGCRLLKTSLWTLATFLLLIIFLPAWLFVRPPLPAPAPMPADQADDPAQKE